MSRRVELDRADLDLLMQGIVFLAMEVDSKVESILPDLKQLTDESTMSGGDVETFQAQMGSIMSTLKNVAHDANKMKKGVVAINNKVKETTKANKLTLAETMANLGALQVKLASAADSQK